MKLINSTFIAAVLSTIIICSFFTTHLYAQTTNVENGNNGFEFNGLKFGQSPTSDMICINGSCLTQDQTSETRRTNNLFAIYKKQKDITNYNGVEISSPKYQFFQNKLTRIIFEVDCEKIEEKACFKKTKENLIKAYDPWLAKSVSPSEDNFNIFEAEIFTTELNEIMEFLWVVKSNEKRKPFVKIYQKELLDNARIAANPNYNPKELTN